ncbi:hypothetical protein MRB53_033852 [Persea americana]|uniref:Uncharacterized protein n=1 Tax=Persea americana TaxID=3435 RepID=A0ACC2KWV5_PERAE|nr:hypothetical protein MRB53_033852 [Persea americana]
MRCFGHFLYVVLQLLWVTTAWPRPQVPCFFIFGDSLVDNGNNNAILTLSRANYIPYGIDFPEGVTGRFTNGRTIVDLLAQLLGFRDFIPPFVTTGGRAVLRGLNYASGASGIRDETGFNLGDHMSMDQQLANFQRTVRQMRRILGGNSSRVHDHLSKCIYYVGMGSNDYLNNYFMPNLYPTSLDYSPKTYAAVLIADYKRQLTQLYNLGARKVAVSAVGQIGCIPYELARINRRSNNGSRCDARINKAIKQFNSGLRNLVNRLNKGELPGAKLVYIDSYRSSNDLVQNGASYGFEVVDKGCCGVGRNNGQVTCLPLQQVCDDRSKYIFWDAFHPTEAANIILARKSYNSKSHSDVYPMNIQQLARAR